MAGEEILFGSSTLEAGFLSGLSVGLIALLVIWSVAIYVYFALAFQSIAKKSGYKRPWFAWIPILNLVMILQLGGFNWAWIFLYAGAFIPGTTVLSFVGALGIVALLVLVMVSLWRIFKKAGYAGALSLLMLIPIARIVIVGIVAWEKKFYRKTVVKTAIKKKAVKATPVKKTVTKKATKKVVAKKKK